MLTDLVGQMLVIFSFLFFSFFVSFHFLSCFMFLLFNRPAYTFQFERSIVSHAGTAVFVCVATSEFTSDSVEASVWAGSVTPAQRGVSNTL